MALTEYGASLIKDKFAEHTKHMDAAFSVLEQSEIEQLQSLLRKLGKGAEKALHSPSTPE